MPKIKDITLYFLSDCCITKNSNNEGHSETLVRSMPLGNEPSVIRKAEECFKVLPIDSLYAGTITIGNKYYGKMDYRNQYKHMKQAINDFIKKIGKGKAVYATFELTQNGQVHSHLLIYNVYQSLFVESFKKFGSRNKLDISYMPVKDIDKYLTYMKKEVLENKEEYNFTPLFFHNL